MSNGMRCLRNSDSIGLMGHIIADFPSREMAIASIDAMATSGVTVIEIQIPFSEPMADGPIFMAANHKALDQGVGLKNAMELMKLASVKYPDVDFVFMSYLNILFKAGYLSFVKEASDAGARGLIVPDIPIDHSQELDSACEKYDICNIRLIAPNTTDERMAKVLKGSKGLVYVVARKGVTGSNTDFSADLGSLLVRVKKYTDAPLAVGFGVKTPEDVKALQGQADYAIIGTKAFQVMEESGAAGLKKYWASLK